jgi:hypothetical protein
VINQRTLMAMKDERLVNKAWRVIESVNSDKQLRATVAYLRLAREAALLGSTKDLFSAWINRFLLLQIAVLQQRSRLSTRTLH